MAYETVGIIGAGAWGTALAINIARGGKKVILWSFDGEIHAFDGVDVPQNLTVVRDAEKLATADVWLNVTPAAFFRETLHKFVEFYHNQPIIICTKGADSRTHEFMSEILNAEIPECNAAVPAGGRMGGAGVEDNPGDAGKLGDLPVEGLPGADGGTVAEGPADPALHACG